MASIVQSTKNRKKECHRFRLRLRHAVILISNDRTSVSKKINGMALIRTITVSTMALQRTRGKFYGFRQTAYKSSFIPTSKWVYRSIKGIEFKYYRRISQMTNQTKSVGKMVDWNVDFLYLTKFKSNVCLLLQGLSCRVLCVPCEKFDSQPSSVFKVILFPTPCHYVFDVTCIVVLHSQF